MKITPEDLRRPAADLWAALREHYEQRLHSLRCSNDVPMDEQARNRLLGRIIEVKALLELDQPEPEVNEPAETSDYGND